MKSFVLIITATILLLGPGWLYASGNFPAPLYNNGKGIMALNDYCPEFSVATFKKSHILYQKLRGLGIKIPMTFNERMLEINKTRTKTIAICSFILNN